MARLHPDTPIEQVPFVYLDTETTGIDPRLGERMCELAMLKVVNGQIVDTWESLLNPGRRISPGASEINNITNEMVQDKPHFKEVIKPVRDFLEGTCIVMHNAPFDLGFLSVQLSVLCQPELECPVLDSLYLARTYYRFPTGNRLGDLGRALKIDAGNLHRALADIELLKSVFEVFIHHFRQGGARTIGDLICLQKGTCQVDPYRDLDKNYQLMPGLPEAFKSGSLVSIDYMDIDGNRQSEIFEPLDVIPNPQGQFHLICRLPEGGGYRQLRLQRILQLETITN